MPATFANRRSGWNARAIAVKNDMNSPTDFSPDRILRLPTAMSAAGASLALSATGLLTFLRMHLDGGVALDGIRYLQATAITEMYTPSAVVPPNDAELLLLFLWIVCAFLNEERGL